MGSSPIEGLAVEVPLPAPLTPATRVLLFRKDHESNPFVTCSGFPPGFVPMVGPFLPRVSDGGFLTSGETGAGVVQTNISKWFLGILRKKTPLLKRCG